MDAITFGYIRSPTVSIEWTFEESLDGMQVNSQRENSYKLVESCKLLMCRRV